MTDREALVAAIREHPDEDTPRLAFADWLDEHGTEDDRTRAAFIRDQIALERLPDPVPDAATFLLRKELWTRIGVDRYARENAWVADLRHPGWQVEPRGFEFRRGFPDRVEGSPAHILEDGGRVFDLAPVRHLWLRPVTAGVLARILARPWLSRVRGLQLNAEYRVDYEPVADCPHLANLESLWLGGGRLSRAGLARLGRSPHLAKLRELTLDCELTDGAELALASPAAFPRLTRLRLIGASLSPTDWAAVADNRALPGLTSLSIRSQPAGSLDAVWARALTRSAFWPNLRELRVWASHLADEPLLKLATAPNPPAPTTLELQSNRLTAAGVAELARSPLLRAVVRLRLERNQIGTDGLVALTGSPFVGNLGEALLDSNPFGPRGAQALARSKNLTRLFALSVSKCEFGEEGFRHLAASPLLDQIVSMYVGDRSEAVKKLLAPQLGDRVKF